MILALAGGVGGAKLAQGLASVLPTDGLCVIVNTGDDFQHLGLHVSPDLDTVMYTLAGINHPDTGWGLADETWRFMQALERLGGDTWFRLGDQDLATNVERTRRLAAGESLSAITEHLRRRLGIAMRLAPMSDDMVRTVVHTQAGALAFQDYFVRRRCAPRVVGLEYRGAEAARPSDALEQALREPSLTGIVICPSNPYLSIAPMLAMPALRRALSARRVPAVAVSPIVGGKAIKGPAAKIMRELGVEPNVVEIAHYYSGLIDGLIVDHVDGASGAAIAALGVLAHATQTVMRSADDRQALARETLAFLASLSRRAAA